MVHVIFFVGCAVFFCRSAYDIMDAPEEEDITSAVGFFSLMKKVLRLKPSSLFYAAHPCSSMVWINSKVHKRKPGRPWGDTSMPSPLAAPHIRSDHDQCPCLQFMYQCMRPRCAVSKYYLRKILHIAVHCRCPALLHSHRAAGVVTTETHSISGVSG